jgi:hypothetical protein
MKAKVTCEFKGRPDEASQVRTIKKGETITGDLARVAVEEKWATEIKDKAAGQAPPAASPALKPLGELSLDELKIFASEKKIDLGDATAPADIIAAIELSLAGSKV